MIGKYFKQVPIKLSEFVTRGYSPFHTKDLIVGIHGDEQSLSTAAKEFFPNELQSPHLLKLNNWKNGDSVILQSLDPWFFQNIGEAVDRIALINLDFDPDILFNNQYPFSSTDVLASRVRNMVEKVVQDLCKDDMSPFEIMIDDMEGYLKEVVHGTVLGLYDYKKHVQSGDYSTISITPIHFFHPEELKEGMVFGSCQNLARFLQDSPSNIMTPSQFCDEIYREFEAIVTRMTDNGNTNYSNNNNNKEDTEQQQHPQSQRRKIPHNVKIEEHDESWAYEKGFNLFLGVSKGSETPSKILEGVYWGNKDSAKIDLALVGKGITFDSGGYNLKPETSMRDMKGDMGGAAVVWSALKGLVELEVNINVVVLSPLCENMIGGNAQKPGDVIESRNGKSVELENTDAEGRLILADALSYIEEYDPTYILDVSTLTGAISIALGDFPGVFSTSNDLWEMYLESSLKSGEYCWRMPMFSEYLNCLKDTSVADLKNLSSNRDAGSCVAAMFLNEFISDNRPYLHIDIAGSHHNGDDGMTGNTTSTLIEFGKLIAGGRNNNNFQ